MSADAKGASVAVTCSYWPEICGHEQYHYDPNRPADEQPAQSVPAAVTPPVPHYVDDLVTLHHGDCLDVMRQMPDASVDSIVTDPPYGLGFMGKAWDELPPGLPWAQECLRILKPGGHLLAFGGTRTSHRLTSAIEDAGFEIRDSIAWLYGSGFPKSRNVGKDVPSHEGWGTALKPAHEPIVVARRPLIGSVALNVQRYTTGALNIDGCRINPGSPVGGGGNGTANVGGIMGPKTGQRERVEPHNEGRWPGNVALDEDAAAELDEQSGTLATGGGKRNGPKAAGTFGAYRGEDPERVRAADAGGASRFFYVAKAPKKERVVVDGVAHPTVKPVTLMRWLVRLVTPPGGVVLEPFAGSGTTVEACLLEGFRCIAIEREASYLPLIQARIDRHEPDLFGGAA